LSVDFADIGCQERLSRLGLAGMIKLRIAGVLPRDPELQIEWEGEWQRVVRRFQLARM